MFRYVRLALLLAGLLALFPVVCSAVEDDEGFRFVDAQGMTGYYVDVNSISVDSDHEYTARIAVIKADRNRMFTYHVHFDYGDSTYQILDATVLAYDTREVLDRVTEASAPQPYSQSSPMQGIVDYIYAMEHGFATN